MEKIYKIRALKDEGEEVKIVVEDNMIKKGLSFTNPGKLVEQMTGNTVKLNDPDQIRVPKDFWEQYKWNIGDNIKISVEVV